MITPFSDSWLVEYSREHLLHELSMLWETSDRIQKHERGSTEYAALLESFAIHLRNLIEFFFFDEHSDYVRAKHFFDDPKAWSPARPPEVNKLHARASNEVSHLTTKRIPGSPPEKDWHPAEALKLIEGIAKEFAEKAPATKLDEGVREFLRQPTDRMLDWVMNNVRHSKVVVTDYPALSVFSASTATVRVGAVLLPDTPASED